MAEALVLGLGLTPLEAEALYIYHHPVHSLLGVYYSTIVSQTFLENVAFFLISSFIQSSTLNKI